MTESELKADLELRRRLILDAIERVWQVDLREIRPLLHLEEVLGRPDSARNA